MTYDTDHNDVYVEEREGSSMGTILGIILAIVVVLAIVWFFFLGGLGQNNPPAEQNQDTQVEIQPPPVEQPIEPPVEPVP
jgi:hypothetical protein